MYPTPLSPLPSLRDVGTTVSLLTDEVRLHRRDADWSAVLTQVENNALMQVMQLTLWRACDMKWMVQNQCIWDVPSTQIWCRSILRSRGHRHTQPKLIGGGLILFAHPLVTSSMTHWYMPYFSYIQRSFYKLDLVCSLTSCSIYPQPMSLCFWKFLFRCQFLPPFLFQHSDITYQSQ